MATPQAATSFWRIAGMSYLQYVGKSASTIRAGLKEPAKRKAMAQETFAYNRAIWKGGEQSAKEEVGTGFLK
eukprot:CAMPEP_0119005958 /NCGR_PEP_ID=MMETSP1176-20130426/2028_1 /TAXON_ID=265551 /ORGANISM="Synedropsis recta cf, Strain CCMP1620" /LENGTH=71 /DNA_ID=CAMNT_0006957823 /DNA_START=94 /DNA_END=309 /DNA_ORIENTATION=+